MQLATEWIRYGEQGEYRGYAARPASVNGPLPAVIVLQEIWGVDEHIQDVTRRFAEAGYAAFAPDLFAEGGVAEGPLTQERIEAAKQFLNTIPSAHWRDKEQRTSALALLPQERREAIDETLERLFDLGGRFPAFVRQAAVTASWLRDKYEHTAGQHVASVGFCLGGALSAALAANDRKLRGAVIFYGNAPSEDLIPAIQCPLLGLYGELDQRITDQVPAFAHALKGAGKSFEYHIYEGAQHAFFNDTRPTYHVDAARDAFVRTLDFLERVLTGETSVAD
jgi:carboxymethylenebutenolidase